MSAPLLGIRGSKGNRFRGVDVARMENESSKIPDSSIEKHLLGVSGMSQYIGRVRSRLEDDSPLSQEPPTRLLEPDDDAAGVLVFFGRGMFRHLATVGDARRARSTRPWVFSMEFSQKRTPITFSVFESRRARSLIAGEENDEIRKDLNVDGDDFILAMALALGVRRGLGLFEDLVVTGGLEKDNPRPESSAWLSNDWRRLGGVVTRGQRAGGLACCSTEETPSATNHDGPSHIDGYHYSVIQRA